MILRHFYSKKECQACGHNYNHDENLQTDNPNSSSEARHKTLRKLLGLKPDEKNVLVMLKL